LETPISRLLVAGDVIEGKTIAVDYAPDSGFAYDVR